MSAQPDQRDGQRLLTPHDRVGGHLGDDNARVVRVEVAGAAAASAGGDPASSTGTCEASDESGELAKYQVRSRRRPASVSATSDMGTHTGTTLEALRSGRGAVAA